MSFESASSEAISMLTNTPVRFQQSGTGESGPDGTYGGLRHMCQAIEKIADEKVEARNKEFAIDLIRDGEKDDEKIARLSHITTQKVKEIRADLEAITA